MKKTKFLQQFLAKNLELQLVAEVLAVAGVECVPNFTVNVVVFDVELDENDLWLQYRSQLFGKYARPRHFLITKIVFNIF